MIDKARYIADMLNKHIRRGRGRKKEGGRGWDGEVGRERLGGRGRERERDRKRERKGEGEREKEGSEGESEGETSDTSALYDRRDHCHFEPCINDVLAQQTLCLFSDSEAAQADIDRHSTISTMKGTTTGTTKGSEKGSSPSL